MNYLNFRNAAPMAFVLCCLHAGQVAGEQKGKQGDRAKPISIGSRLELFLDDKLIESMHKVELRLHSPQRAEVVIKKDKPWEDSTMYDPVVIKDGSRYRMWYRTNFNTAPYYTGYAESDDGVRWTKPSLGLVEFRGEKNNNLVWSSGPDKSAPYVLCVFRDDNPKTKAKERYKAIGLRRRPGSDPPTDDLFGLVSPDGLSWQMLQKEPIISGPRGDSMFDSYNICFWDSARNQYVIYARGWPDGWPSGTRGIRRTVSSDFRHWAKLETLDLWKDADRDHLYKNAATPYYRRPDILLMFPKRFIPGRKSLDPKWKQGGLSDIVFMSSRDGVHWDRRFREAFLRPGRDSLNWHERAIEVGPGLVPTGDGEMSLYFVEHYRTESVGIRRAVLREDGLVSVHAKYLGGELLTRPLVFTGDQLFINYSTSAAGSIRVELQDNSGKPIEGYELDACIEIYGDELSRIVRWKGKPNLQELAGKVLRLHIELRDADLFSLQFRSTAKAHAYSRPGQLINPPVKGEQGHMGMGLWNRGNVMVGLQGMWQDASEKPAKGESWNKGVAIDLGLVVSNDGIHFREPVPNFKIIQRGKRGEWDDTALLQGHAFVNDGDKTMIWYSHWDTGGKLKTMEPGLATLRRDGFGYLSAQEDDNDWEFIADFVEIGNKGKAFLNVSGVSQESPLTIELLDHLANPLPDFSGVESIKITSNGTRVPIPWSKTIPKGKIAIRVKYPIGSKAEIHAIYLNK